MDKPPHIVKMTSSVNYQISVQGNLDPRWSGRLGGLAITTSFQLTEPGAPVTQLAGRLEDQAALFGVLNTLYQLHLPLISIISLEDDVEQGSE